VVEQNRNVYQLTRGQCCQLKRAFYALLTLIMLLLACSLIAELSITSYVDNTTIGQNQNLRLTVEISGEKAAQIPQPELPSISGFHLVGTSTSSSSSFSIVNGRMTSSVTKSYIYTLRPEGAGRFLIPPITIQFEGETKSTNPIRITVTEETSQPVPQTSRQPSQPESDLSNAAENLFVKAEISQTSLYRGEPIVVSYRLYSRYDLANVTFLSEPNFVGFWKEDVFTASRMNLQRTNYQGRMFQSMLLRSVILYPNQSGTLIIPSVELSADVIVRARSFFDFDSTRKFNIKSEPLRITIKDIPTADRPQNYTGAVGSFNISSETSKSRVKVGDTFTLTLKITGMGNFHQLNHPELPELPFLRIIDPEVKTDSRLEDANVIGSISVSYPLIAVREGDYEIPPIQFAYFDPNQERFRIARTSAHKLSIQPSETSIVQHSAIAQTDIVREGTDIYYIHSTSDLNSHKLVTEHFLYWLLLFGAILTLPASFIYRKKRDILLSDSGYLRQKGARRILRKYLKKATEHAHKGDMEFYSYANAGLCNYLTDILQIPRGSTNETIIATLQTNEYPENSVQKIRDIINRCLEARFMPGGFAPEKINKDYETIKMVINEISRIKSKVSNKSLK
jgi:hypothetical protein